MRVPYVDFSRQYAAERARIIEAVDRVFTGGVYILGPEVEAFEASLAKACGVKRAVAVANGTDALVMALKALGVGPGDEVVTAPNSFVASASCSALVGAKPTFCDVGPDQLMDPVALEAALTPRTKAIIPVHLTGRVCDMDAILAVAKRRGIPVIEDAAQAVGASYKGRPAGSFGTMSCFSFHPLKNLNAAGDAGAILTDDDALAERLVLMRNHGLKSRNETSFWGFNSRMDAVQAAVLNVRLEGLPVVTAARRRNAERYRLGLQGAVSCPPDGPGDAYHLFVIQCARRDELQRFLKDGGVSTAIHYPVPIHLQPACAASGYKAGDFPECERQSARILSLPIHQYLTDEQIDHVIARIREFYSA